MRRIFSAIASVLLLASMYVAIINPANAEARSDLDVTFYASPDTAFASLMAGQIDFMPWALTREQRDAAEMNPNVQICRVDELGMYEFDINNNYTILSYPGIRSATYELKVRQAIARLTDKDYIIANILLYFGTRIDAPMSATSAASWADPSVIGSNYPYPYNPQEAANLLTAAGFSDTDSNGWLNYPADWDGAPDADTTTCPLVVCVRNTDVNRLAAGQYLINQLEVMLAGTSIGAGFKTTGTQWQQPRSVLSPKVMGNRDYQVYTGGWSIGRYPTHLFSLFHSQFWYRYGPNYVTGFDKDGNPNYSDVDEAVEHVWYTDSISTAQTASKAFTVLHAQKCITIPLWSYSSYYAWRKELVGVVNENGYGVENDYTFLRAYRVGGGPMRVAVTAGPDRLNILYSEWYFEYSFLNRVYTSALNFEPYNIGVDTPWVVQDWDVALYDNEGTPKTVCTYYIRKDVGIVAPVTGAFVRNFDADDFEFTIWYNYAFSDSWQWGSFVDVKYTKIVDVNGDGWNELQVYFDSQSYWFYTAPTYPLLTKAELLDPLNAQTTEAWAQVGTAKYTLANNVVSVVGCTLDGVPLFEGVDYRIDAGYTLGSHVGFVPLHDLDGALSITYWYADIPATGFYLAGLPWQSTMYSLGTHYPVSVTTDPPGIGDTFVLNKNPNFFLETPVLGEIDWHWYWVGTTKPRSGYYKIDIFDVVKAAFAYCSRGDGAYNPKYFPGADIDPTDLCHIGIYDIVTILSTYGQTFAQQNIDPIWNGSCPPDPGDIGTGKTQCQKDGDIDGDHVDDYKWNYEYLDKKGNKITLWGCSKDGWRYGLRWDSVWVGQCPYGGGQNTRHIDGTNDEYTGTSWTSTDGGADDDNDGKVDSMTYEYSAKTGKVTCIHKHDGVEVGREVVDAPSGAPSDLPAHGTSPGNPLLFAEYAVQTQELWDAKSAYP